MRSRRRKSRNPRYVIKRLFTTGNLKGITHTEESPVKFKVGKIYQTATLGNRCNYRVVSCKRK